MKQQELQTCPSANNNLTEPGSAISFDIKLPRFYNVNQWSTPMDGNSAIAEDSSRVMMQAVSRPEVLQKLLKYPDGFAVVCHDAALSAIFVKQGAEKILGERPSLLLIPKNLLPLHDGYQILCLRDNELKWTHGEMVKSVICFDPALYIWHSGVYGAQRLNPVDERFKDYSSGETTNDAKFSEPGATCFNTAAVQIEIGRLQAGKSYFCHAGSGEPPSDAKDRFSLNASNFTLIVTNRFGQTVKFYEIPESVEGLPQFAHESYQFMKSAQ